MAHFLTQPQQSLHLNCEITITQDGQKIELYGSPMTKELKTSHSSRWVGGAEMCGDVETWKGWFHNHMWWIKTGRDNLGVRDPSLTSDDPAQSSSARKISPDNFWL